MKAIKGIALLLGVVVLAGCGGGGKSGGGGASGQAPQNPIIAQGNIGPTGGTVTVTDPASSYYRTSVQFDAGVVTTPGQMTIQKPQAPVALVEAPEGLLPIDLRLQGIFSGIATVTIPYSEALLVANGVNESEIIVLGEAPNDGFEEMHIVARDIVLNTITFETGHFSTFFAASPVLYAAKYMGLRTFDAFDTAAAGFIDPAKPYTFSSFSTLELPMRNGKQSIKVGKGSLVDFQSGKGRNAVLLHGVLSSSLTWARDGGRDNPNDLYASLIAPQSPYDNVIAYDWPWAIDLETNGRVFAKNMQANTNPSGLYDLFGHSAGGLVAQSAIQNHGLSNIQNLVMLGTPNQGSSLSDIAAYFSLPEIIALLNAKKGNGILDLVSGSSHFLLNLHTSGLSARRGTKYFGIAAGADQWVPVGSVTGIALNDSKIVPNQDHGQVHTNGKNNGAWIYSREWVTGKLNVTPVANAGTDLAITLGQSAILDGSGSTDADPGEKLFYTWTQTGGPTTPITDATSVVANVTPTQAGTYTFELTVSDTDKTGTDTVTITVNPPPFTTATIVLTDDTYIESTYTKQLNNYGGLDTLLAGPTGPQSIFTYQTFFRFEVQSAIPAGATILSATLTCTSLVNVSAPVTVDCYETNPLWSEYFFTWDTRYGSALQGVAGIRIGTLTITGTTGTFDATPYFQTQAATGIAAGTAFSFSFDRAYGNSAVSFAPKERTSSAPPTLTITWK